MKEWLRSDPYRMISAEKEELPLVPETDDIKIREDLLKFLVDQKWNVRERAHANDTRIRYLAMPGEDEEDKKYNIYHHFMSRPTLARFVGSLLNFMVFTGEPSREVFQFYLLLNSQTDSRRQAELLKQKLLARLDEKGTIF